jgi:heat shock protein HslJ
VRELTTRAAGFLLGVCVLVACAEKKTVTTPPATPPLQTQAQRDPPGSAIIVGTVAASDSELTFVHCPTHAPYPIKREGVYDELYRAVVSVSGGTGAPVIVSLMGRLQPMPIVPGRPPRDQMIVDRLLRVWPDETCEKLGVQTPLRNTYWKLVELNGAPVTSHENQKEVHLTLRLDGETVDGFAGCNGFSGRFEQMGPRLRFVKLTSTLMACPYLEEEQAFLNTLERVTNFQILGESLDLRDDAGSLARCRAVYF